MAKRFTETNKWDDKWFRSLKPAEKLVFNFMCDKCDLAGFYEIDMDDMEFRIGHDESTLSGAIEGLNRGYLRVGDVVFLKNFLEHQKNLPLNPSNNAHKHIFHCINSKLNEFPDIPDIIKTPRSLFNLMKMKERE